MSSPHVIHVLTAGDVQTLRAMRAMFGEAFEDPESFSARPPSDDHLRSLLQREFFVAIAALQGQQVVGGLAGYVLPRYEQAHKELYIYDLAVAESHRRRGVATALIDAARRLAGQRDISSVYVQADVEDEPAVALYSKLGSRADVLHFDFEPEIAQPASAPAEQLAAPPAPPAPSFTVASIGTVRAARQQPDDDFWGGSVAEIELAPGFGPECLAGLDAFSHVEVLYVFDRVGAAQVSTGARRPRGNAAWPEVGIFAQRAKNRPNRIGSTICRVLGVAGRVLRVAELDAIDGTPVIDLKPVMREFLPRQATQQPAWAGELMAAYWLAPDRPPS
jgi:tRNA (adenine37-N6)-methyltransferase